MTLYLWESPALCKQAVRNSGFTFLLHSCPLSSRWFPACVPLRGWGQVSGNAAKDKGKHRHAGEGGSAAAAPPSLLLCCCTWVGRALSPAACRRGPGTRAMPPSCHCHADAPAVGVTTSQALVDGGFALSGSAVFAGVLADPRCSPFLR